MRIRLAASIITALMVAACSGTATTAPTSMPETSTPAASTAPSEAPSAPATQPSAAPSTGTSGSSLDLGSASSVVSNLDSYRMDITVKSGSDTQTLMVEATKTPVEAAHYALGGDQSLEFITIKGQGSWLKQGDAWTPVPAGADAMLSMFDALAPDKLISAYSLGQFGNVLTSAGTEDHNGVQAAHFHLDGGLASQLGATGFPSDGTFDAWVAADGGYLVGIEYSGTDTSSGEQVQMTVDVTHVNDPGLVIEAPAGG